MSYSPSRSCSIKLQKINLRSSVLSSFEQCDFNCIRLECCLALKVAQLGEGRQTADVTNILNGRPSHEAKVMSAVTEPCTTKLLLQRIVFSIVTCIYTCSCRIMVRQQEHRQRSERTNLNRSNPIAQCTQLFPQLSFPDSRLATKVSWKQGSRFVPLGAVVEPLAACNHTRPVGLSPRPSTFAQSLQVSSYHQLPTPGNPHSQSAHSKFLKQATCAA